MGPLIEYLKIGQPLHTLMKNKRIRLALKALPFTIIEGKLYQLGQDNVLRKCLDYNQGQVILKQLHDGPAGGHFATRITIKKVLDAGY